MEHEKTLKEKFMEVSMLFMDIIDRLTILTEARIKEIYQIKRKIQLCILDITCNNTCIILL